MTRSKNPQILLAFLALAVLTVSVNADVPNVINYQGRLTDDAGQPVNGSKLIKFKIYGSQSGNDSLWSSGYQIVQINEGLFNYELGSNILLPEDLFTETGSRYLGITVDTDAEILPRTQFDAEAYAIRARTADSIVGAPYVLKTGDTITGHMYFDGDGLGKDAELLLYNDLSIMNLYQGGTKAISMESEFATIILRDPDGDYSLRLNGGEDPEYDGGMIRLFNAHGVSQMSFDGGQTGDLSVALLDNAINSSEMLNEPGIAFNTYSDIMEVTSSSMMDLLTVSITTPAPGYVHVTAKMVVRRTVPSPVDECYCGTYLQVDTAAGGSMTIPNYSFIYSWVSTTEETTPYVERTFYLNSAGTYEFRLEGSRYAGSEDCTVVVYSGSITAVYYPTFYGVTK